MRSRMGTEMEQQETQEAMDAPGSSSFYDPFSVAVENAENKEFVVDLPKDDIDVDGLSSDDEEGATIEDNKRAVSKNECDAEVTTSVGNSSEPEENLNSSSSEEDTDSSSEDGEVVAELDDYAEDEDEEGVFQGPIRSKNELVEEPIPVLPENFTVDESTPIRNIGVIKAAFDNNVIITGTISGENRVLKEGSVLCLEDRVVIGPICEIFGQLSSPHFRVAFPKGEEEKVKEFQSKIGHAAFYVTKDASWMDTFEIRQIKGSDASNGVDEEVPEEEQEFSDDEREAEFKRERKLAKKRKGNNDDQSQRMHTNRSIPANIPKMKPPVSMMDSQERSFSSYRPRSARRTRDEPPIAASVHRGHDNISRDHLPHLQKSSQPQEQNFIQQYPGMVFGQMQYPPHGPAMGSYQAAGGAAQTNQWHPNLQQSAAHLYPGYYNMPTQPFVGHPQFQQPHMIPQTTIPPAQQQQMPYQKEYHPPMDQAQLLHQILLQQQHQQQQHQLQTNNFQQQPPNLNGPNGYPPSYRPN